MSRFLNCCCAIFAAFLLAAPALAEDQPAWSYDGATGPANWASLSPEFGTCDGSQQSPVALQSTTAVGADVPTVFLDLQQFEPVVVNDGHKIKVTTGGEGGLVTYQGNDYQLQEFHFHHPFEHVVDGRSYPLEAHFVLQSAAGDLFVLGVLFGEAGANATLQTILDKAPATPGKARLDAYIDPNNLLPVDTRFFRYKGSLTTPPCGENVTWHVYKETLSASKAQIDAFSRLYRDNHRPPQPLNRRYVLEGE